MLGTIVLREKKLQEVVTNLSMTHFLGHVISDEGIVVDIVKVKTIMEGLHQRMSHNCVSS
jgi:hypothetical protein